MKYMRYLKKWFTLVELIVVITILAVLGTIAFVSFQWYAKTSRDSARITDIKSIEKVLTLGRLNTWFFPGADNAIPVVFSGSTIWAQWTFWEEARKIVGRISNVPVDPLTKTEYAYSTTYSKNEFELGATFEWDWLVKNVVSSEAIAWDRRWTSYVHGEYNGQIIQKIIGDRLYVLAVPTIINANMWDVEYSDIVNNWTFALNWWNNLADSYSWSVFNTLGWWNNLAVNPGNMIVFSWSSQDLVWADPTNRNLLLRNIQAAYTGTTTIVRNPSSVGATMAVDVNNVSELEGYANTLVNNVLGGNLTVSNTSNATPPNTPLDPPVNSLTITFPWGNQSVTCTSCY